MNINYERHYVSKLFGDLPHEALESLKTDIAYNGIIKKVIVTMDGKIIDGWHRYTVATKLGIDSQLKFTNFSCDDLDASELCDLVLTSNFVSREYLSTSQKSAIAVEVNDWFIEHTAMSSRSYRLLSQSINLSATYIGQATKLRSESPNLFKQVINGDLALYAANRMSNGKKPNTTSVGNYIPEDFKPYGTHVVYAIETCDYGLHNGILVPCIAFGHSTTVSFKSRAVVYVYKRFRSGNLRGILVFPSKKSALDFEKLVYTRFSHLSGDSKEVVMYTDDVRDYVASNFDDPSIIIGNRSLRDYVTSKLDPIKKLKVSNKWDSLPSKVSQIKRAIEEARGICMRDEFDSSFDDAIEVLVKARRISVKDGMLIKIGTEPF